MLNKFKIVICLIMLSVVLGRAPQAGAFFLEDWLVSVKNIFTRPSPQAISLDAKVERKLTGDINKNNVVDGGDIVTFEYTIHNPTTKEISFATLKTNIPRKHLNYIHNIEGAMSLSDKNNTITIPNLRINPGQTLTIKFDARINYFTDSEKSITTEPEIITSDRKSLIKAKRQEIKANIWKGKLNSNIERRIKE